MKCEDCRYWKDGYCKLRKIETCDGASCEKGEIRMKYDYDERIPDHFTVILDESTNKKVQEALKDVCREIVNQVIEDKIINGAATVYFHLDVLAVRKRTGNEPFGEEKKNELS